jgi:protein-L-isoaspartate(D-aspartate) O-methyltransferase
MASTQNTSPRRWYAEEIRWSAGITDERIIRAFERVPREDFLPPGPWLFSTAMIPEQFRETRDADPFHLYHNVVVAIDAARDLSTALPSYMAAILEHSGVTPGARVCQIGVGLGYYTAIIAEIVDTAGTVFALEIDGALADQARANLTSYRNVECVTADGSSHPLQPETFDTVIVNAGVSNIQRSWLQSLCDGGRLIVPLIFSDEEPGQIARITRCGDRFRVEFILDTMVYPCSGSYDTESAKRLRQAVEVFGWYSDTELRLDTTYADDSAWIVTPSYWISMVEFADTPAPVPSTEEIATSRSLKL